MKTKLKVIIPIGIALVIIALAFVFIRFDSSEELDLKAMVHNAYEYMTEMDYERAVAEFEKIINIDPRNAEAYIGIAEAYEAMGDIEKAVEWLEKGYEATGDESIKAMLDRLLDDMQGEVSEVVTSVSEEVTTEETTTETTVEITTVTEETTTETTMVTEEAILEITSITDQTIEVDVHNEVDLLSDFIDVVARYDTSYDDQSDSSKWNIIRTCLHKLKTTQQGLQIGNNTNIFLVKSPNFIVL